MDIKNYTPMNEKITLDAKIIAEVKKRLAFKILNKRKFATVKGYPEYSDIMMVMAANIELAEIGCEMLTSNNRWLWLCTVDIFARAATYNTFPVYRVDPDLMTILLETEEPKQFKNELPTPFVESALFLFPKGAVKVGCQCIDWLMVDYVDVSQKETVFEFDKGSVKFERLNLWDSIRYRWATQTRSEDPEYPGDLFVSTFGYTSTREVAPGENMVGMREKDAELTKRLTRLTKHLLLWLQQPKEHEYIEVTRARGFGKTPKNVKPAARYPIKLGVDEQPHKIYKYTPTNDRPQRETTRKSPVPHDRASHWRYVPVGPRPEGRRELKVIRSTRVNAEGLTALGINEIIKGNLPDS
jgi:hypothetical protein